MLLLSNSIIDGLLNELGERFTRSNSLNSKFGFLLDVKEFLTSTNEKHTKERCIDVAKFYEHDLDGLELFSEVTGCRMLLRLRNSVLI